MCAYTNCGQDTHILYKSMQEQDRGGDLLKEAPSLRQAELAGTGDEVCRFPSVVPKRISLSYSLNLLFPAFSKVLPPNRETEKDVLRKKNRLPPCSQDLPGLCPVSALPSSSATATAILFHLFFSPGKKKTGFLFSVRNAVQRKVSARPSARFRFCKCYR